MALSRRSPDTLVITAMLCAGAVGAQFIGGKATRDALFLAHLDVTSLPAMVMTTAGVSILLVALSSRCLRVLPPGVVIPAAFAINAVLLLAEWALVGRAPALAAQAVYLQISGLGPMLGSGFWLIASERFDPRTAKKRFGQIAGVGTLGGLVGALLAERIAAVSSVTVMLPLLAGVNLLCAWQVRRLGAELRTTGETRSGPLPLDATPELVAASPRSGLRVLAEAPYLRSVAALVLLGTIGATLVDYVFKVRAVDALGRGDDLLRFFALYYAAVSLLTFLVQATSATALQRLGLATAASTPSAALLMGGLGTLAVPGLGAATLLRGGESVFRGSLFKTAYEIFYTPIPAQEKRAAKSIIDVGFDRAGDALGGGLVRALMLLPASRHQTAILTVAIGCAAAALVIARRLNQAYIQTLERSLVNRAVELDLSDVEDLTTRTVMLRTLRAPLASGVFAERASYATATLSDLPVADAEVQQILALRSRDRGRILAVLDAEPGVAGPLVPHVIPLLAWDPVAEHAVRALRRVAEEHVGELVDALINPNQPFAVRRRLARVFSVCVSQRAVDGLLLGLEDQRFEVRFQCGRSLAAVLEKNGLIRIERERIFEVVRREALVSRPVWESQRLLDKPEEDRRSFVDDFLKTRAGQSLAHVFTLLSLVLPATPLQIAFRLLHMDNRVLRGTALEYLEEVLPPDIRDRLFPFLGGAEEPRPRRARDEIVAELLRSNESMQLNLEELRRRHPSGPTGASTHA
jgi:AAA family ATP:ADP antiporter